MPVTNHPVVGKVSWDYGSGTSLVLDPHWAAEHIGPVFVPQLKGVQTYGGRFSGNVQFYKPAHAQLKAAFEAVEAAGLLHRVIFWDGSWVPRLKRGGSTPSNHTFATAFDINAEWNPFRQRPAGPGEKGYLQDLYPIFEAHGFFCGGRWKNTPDGMHFEIQRLIRSPEKSAAQPTEVIPQLKQQPKLVIIRGGTRYLVSTSELSGGHFVASAAELTSAILGNDLKVNAVEFMALLKVKPFDQKNFLEEKNRVEVYI